MQQVWVKANQPTPPTQFGLNLPKPRGNNGWWPGQLLAWRWEDQKTRTWRALVRYTRDTGLVYEHWVDGADLKAQDDSVLPNT